MAPRTFPLVKWMTKAGLAGGALFVVYSQGLLGGSDKGAEALHKAKAAVPPAVEEWTKYFGWQCMEKRLQSQWKATLASAKEQIAHFAGRPEVT